MSKPTVEQADLMMRLYEMRRDPEMRRARAYLAHEFQAKTWDEVGYMTGTDPDRNFRMDTSYWEMVAAIVTRGLNDEGHLRRAAILGRDARGGGMAMFLATEMAGL